MVGQDAVGKVGRRLAGGGKGGWCRGELRGGCFKRQAGQPVQASGVEMNGFFFFPLFSRKCPETVKEQGVGRNRPQERRRLSLSTGPG